MSESSSPATTGERQVFTGGSQAMMIAGVVGLLGLVATGIGFATNPARTAPSYLVAFVYWIGISVAMVIMLSIFHASGAQWMTVLRRQMENIASAVMLGIVFFIPIVLFREKLYLWTNHDLVSKLSEHSQHLMHHKAPYLNVPFFIGRAVFYFVIWGGLAFLYRKWSVDQDSRAFDPEVRPKMTRVASVALPVLGITITFAGIDWMMSLEPEWPSTMFGVYYFAGSFLAAFASLTLATVLPMNTQLHGAITKGSHLHNLGKFMLAFTAFWAYISFSQLIIIFHANIPEEASFFFARGIQGISAMSQAAVQGQSPNPVGDQWFPLTFFLFVGHFVLPLLALLSQRLKMNRKYIATVAFWLLFVHYLDLYWAVLPAMRLVNESLSTPSPSWTDIAAFAGIGGIGIAFVIFRMRGTHTVPVNDPGLPISLRYEQP